MSVLKSMVNVRFPENQWSFGGDVHMINPIFYVVPLNGKADSAVVVYAFCPSSNPGHVTFFEFVKMAC